MCACAYGSCVCVSGCAHVVLVCVYQHTHTQSVSGVLAGFGTLLGLTQPRQPVGGDKLWHVYSHIQREREQLLLLQLLLSPNPELPVPKKGERGGGGGVDEKEEGRGGRRGVGGKV